jgi:hypothetical protein
VNCAAVRFSFHDLRTLDFHTESENSVIKSNRFETIADASIFGEAHKFSVRYVQIACTE